MVISTFSEFACGDMLVTYRRDEATGQLGLELCPRISPVSGLSDVRRWLESQKRIGSRLATLPPRGTLNRWCRRMSGEMRTLAVSHRDARCAIALPRAASVSSISNRVLITA